MRQQTVEKIARSRVLPHVVVQRANAWCMFQAGFPIHEIALALHRSEDTVSEWLHRFAERGIRGLYDRQPIERIAARTPTTADKRLAKEDRSEQLTLL
jgi:transposase